MKVIFFPFGIVTLFKGFTFFPLQLTNLFAEHIIRLFLFVIETNYCLQQKGYNLIGLICKVMFQVPLFCMTIVIRRETIQESNIFLLT